jgi:hypothetical protein
LISSSNRKASTAPIEAFLRRFFSRYGFYPFQRLSCSQSALNLNFFKADISALVVSQTGLFIGGREAFLERVGTERIKFFPAGLSSL